MQETILEFIKSEFIQNETEFLDAEYDLLASGTLNSLGMMKLIRFIEQEFNLSIPFEDMTAENFGSVDKITTYLSSN